VAAIFTLGTACVLVFAAPGDLDLVSPVAQTLSRGTRDLGVGVSIVPLAMLFMLIARIGSGSIIFNMLSRLPMVAGWDHLLPAWFTRLHPRYRTPLGSVAFVAAMVMLVALLANLGVGSQEAYQLLNNGSGVAYALAYLVMFAIPLFAVGGRPSPWVRLAAASGFVMTLLYVVCSVFPIIDVPDRAAFTLKLLAVIAASNGLGVGFFLLARRRRARATAPSASSARRGR
jgi:amino acid transporter